MARLLRQAVGEVHLLGLEAQPLGGVRELLQPAEQGLEPLTLLRAHALELVVLVPRELVACDAGKHRKPPDDEGDEQGRAGADPPEVTAVEEEVDHAPPNVRRVQLDLEQRTAAHASTSPIGSAAWSFSSLA
jgi:hypothetical protein